MLVDVLVKMEEARLSLLKAISYLEAHPAIIGRDICTLWKVLNKMNQYDESSENLSRIVVDVDGVDIAQRVHCSSKLNGGNSITDHNYSAINYQYGEVKIERYCAPEPVDTCTTQNVNTCDSNIIIDGYGYSMDRNLHDDNDILSRSLENDMQYLGNKYMRVHKGNINVDNVIIVKDPVVETPIDTLITGNLVDDTNASNHTDDDTSSESTIDEKIPFDMIRGHCDEKSNIIHERILVNQEYKCDSTMRSRLNYNSPYLTHLPDQRNEQDYVTRYTEKSESFCDIAMISKCKDDPDFDENASDTLMIDLCDPSYTEVIRETKHKIIGRTERDDEIDKELHVCHVCNMTFISNCKLRAHKKTHTNCGFACSVCDKEFRYPRSLRRHENIHQDVNYNTCKICDKHFKTKSNFKEHLRIHTGARPYTCTICGHTAKQPGHLKSHMATHLDIRPHKCASCGRGFTNKQDCKRHEIIHSRRDRKFKCGKCGKGFMNETTLAQHEKFHSERAYICDFCERRFVHAAHLKAHIVVHTGQKSHVCEICGKRFARKNELTCHLRVHTGEKPYECNVCGKRFSESGNLTTHERRHNVHMPYACPFSGCTDHFSHRVALNRHFKQHEQSLKT